MADLHGDPDLIARIYAVGEMRNLHCFQYATDALLSRQHPMPEPPDLTSRAFSPRAQNSRESTVPPEDQGQEDLSQLPYLDLRFSKPPRAQGGYMFGRRSQTCDSVFPNLQRLGREHLAVTFREFPDGCFRLVVVDLNSTMGTTVTYDGLGAETRRCFKWIVGGHEFLGSGQEVNIEVYEHLKFRIVVPPRDFKHPAFVANVRTWLQGAAPRNDPLHELRLASARSTALHGHEHSQARHGPRHDPAARHRPVRLCRGRRVPQRQHRQALYLPTAGGSLLQVGLETPSRPAERAQNTRKLHACAPRWGFAQR